MYKKRLFTPGPTPIPEEIMLEMAKPILHHRHKEFQEIFQRVSKYLQQIFKTKNQVWLLTSSGTGAMECAVQNFFSKNDEIIFVNGGKFGERWGKICSAFGLQTHEIKIDWGNILTSKIILNAIKKFPNSKAIFLTQNETSTGTVIDLEKISKIINQNSKMLIVVDGISSVGAIELQMDKWEIDILIASSQKGFRTPPGISFIAASKTAFQKKSLLPKFYFNLNFYKNHFFENETPWTPTITTLCGLDLALKNMCEETIEKIWKEHSIIAKGIRIGCKNLGLKLFSKSPSNSMTAVYLPKKISVNKKNLEKFHNVLKYKYKITIADGQDNLKGKIIRISHLGYYDRFDAFSIIAAIENTLLECKIKINIGKSLQKMQQFFSKNL